MVSNMWKLQSFHILNLYYIWYLWHWHLYSDMFINFVYNLLFLHSFIYQFKHYFKTFENPSFFHILNNNIWWHWPLHINKFFLVLLFLTDVLFLMEGLVTFLPNFMYPSQYCCKTRENRIFQNRNQTYYIWWPWHWPSHSNNFIPLVMFFNWCVVLNAYTTCLHLTSSNEQRYVPGMITSLRSKYMTSGYHHGRLITSWRERAYRICRLSVITANRVLNMW